MRPTRVVQENTALEGVIIVEVLDYENEPHRFAVPEEGYNKWLNNEDLIQNCFPKLTKDEREIFITGFTEEMWNEIFANQLEK
jgi:hypothetical protein